MKHIKEKLKTNLELNKIPNFCPFECVLLHFMLDIKSNGAYANTSITDIYNIVDIYSKSYKVDTSGHENCLCNKCFDNASATTVTNTKIDKMKDYLCAHFEKIKYIDSAINSFHEKYPQVNWLFSHVVKYNGSNKNFKIWRQLQLVGYDTNTVIIGYVKPQFNKLNFNEVLMASIYDTHMLKHVQKYSSSEDEEEGKTSENYNKFNGKKIITCVFTLDKREPYIICWEDEGIDLVDANSEMLKQNVYSHLKDIYSTENNSIYYFYKYWVDNCPAEHSKPEKFIMFLLDKYNEIKEMNETEKRSFPAYIIEFLNFIKFKIDCTDDKKSKKAIIEHYKDRDMFMSELDKKLDISIKRYLDIRNTDDVSDSDSD